MPKQDENKKQNQKQNKSKSKIKSTKKRSKKTKLPKIPQTRVTIRVPKISISSTLKPRKYTPEQLHEIRVQQGKKLAELMKQRREAERLNTEEQNIETEENTPEYTDDEIDEGYIIMKEVRFLINQAPHHLLVGYLNNLFDNELSAYGEEEVIKRILSANTNVVELAQGIQYPSDVEEILYNANALANIITAGNYDPEQLEHFIHLDIKNDWRARMRRRTK